MNELVVLCSILLASPAAAPVPLSTRQAISEAIAHNPTLEAAVLDLRRAEQDVRAEDARYRPVLLLSVGVTHLESPSLRSDDGITFPTSDGLDGAAQVSHTFSFGTHLEASLAFNRGVDVSQFGAGGTTLVTLGPAYGLVGRLSVNQPLLRGFGDEVGEAALRQARLGRDASALSRDRTASEVLRDVLVAYWELWYATRAAEIDRAAFELAVQQRDQAQDRLAAGAIAPVDVLTFETRVAELEQAQVASEATRRQRSLELSALLGRAGDEDQLVAGEAEVPQPAPPVAREMLAEATAESYELRQLEVQLATIRDQALLAGEADRARLDVDAYVQAQGLGNEEIPPAFEQFFGLDAVSAHVGLTFELPLSSTRRDAAQQSAALAVKRVEAQLRATEQQLRATASTALVSLDQARRRIELTTTTATLAARSASAQEERYSTGDAILLEVYEAQDALRRARLGVERSRVDAQQAVLRIQHLRGRLVAENAVTVD